VLDAPLIVLYGRDGDRNRVELFRRTGPWAGATADALLRLGYPNPRGDAYLVAQLEALPRPRWLSMVNVLELAPRGSLKGEPFSASWLDLVLSIEATSG
jgi:hypothetical protein